MTLRQPRIKSAGGGQQRTKKAKVEAVVAKIKERAAESTTSASEQGISVAVNKCENCYPQKKVQREGSTSSTSTQGTEGKIVSVESPKREVIWTGSIPCTVSLEGEGDTIIITVQAEKIFAVKSKELGRDPVPMVSILKAVADTSSHRQVSTSTEEDTCGQEVDKELLWEELREVFSKGEPSPKSQKAYKKFLKEGIKKKVADHPWRAGKGSVGKEMREIDNMEK